MNKLTKHINWTISLERNNSIINIVYKNWSIELSKKDISELFQVKKKDISDIISSLDIKHSSTFYNKAKDKTTKIYSIDSIIIVWYKLKKYNETKLLIKTNRIIKNTYSSNSTILEIVKNKYIEIKNKIESFQFV